jgi:DHA2 family multidrug resistance protein-like MFS transporter
MPPPSSGLEQDGLPPGPRRWAIAASAIAISMAVLDTAIANVALPTIAVDVQASAADSIWVVNAYQLAVIVCLLPLASFGEIVGYARVYRAGLAVFTLASLACALSDSLATLAAARVLQGAGAAGIMGVNTALIRFIYPQARLGAGIGVNALVVAVASAVGPSAAAGILAVAPWPWLFAVNVPVGLLALALAWRSLPQVAPVARRFDWPSAALNGLAFGLLISALDGLGHGERAAGVAAELAAAVAAGWVLARRQLRMASPLLPVDLLRIPVFALSVATSVCSFAAQTLAFVALPFYFQDVLGRGEVATGLLMTPWPAAVAVSAPIAGRLLDRVAPGVLGGLGLAMMTAGLAALWRLPAAPGDLAMVWRMMLCGAGFGFFQVPNNRTLIASAPRHRTGGASGMLSTARLLGQTGGAALVALLFARVAGGAAGAAGTDAVLALATVFSAVGCVVSLARGRGGAGGAGASGRVSGTASGAIATVAAAGDTLGRGEREVEE